MADFWCILIGICMAAVVCGLAYGVGAFCAWLTQPRDDASDDDAEWLHVSGFEFIHIEREQ